MLIAGLGEDILKTCWEYGKTCMHHTACHPSFSGSGPFLIAVCAVGGCGGEHS